MEPRQKNRKEKHQRVRDAASERQRKKCIGQLLRQLKLVRSSNTIYEAEVSRLRTELEKYKSLLWEHRNCSVTRAEKEDFPKVLTTAQPIKIWTDYTATAILASPEETYQGVSKPVTKVLKKSSTSAKTSRKTTNNVALPRVPEKVSKTITSSVGSQPLNSISKNYLSQSSVQNTGIISGKLNSVSTAHDTIPNGPPPGIPIISNVTSITFVNEEENSLKTKVLKVGNPGKYYLVNMPIAGHPNVPSAELKLGLAQENRNEPCSNSVELPKSGFLLVKNTSEIKETEPETSKQIIQVPEMSIMDTVGIPLSLEKPVTPVEEMVCPEILLEEDVIILKEMCLNILNNLIFR